MSSPRASFERLLLDDLNRLADRIAGRVSDDTAAGLRARDPELGERLEISSVRLADLRIDLAHRYAAWEEALDECEGLWALAEARTEAGRMTEAKRAA